MARKQNSIPAPEASEAVQVNVPAPEASEAVQVNVPAPEAPEAVQVNAPAPEAAHELVKTVDGLALDMNYKLSNAALIHVRASAFGIVSANQNDLAALKAQADGLKQKVNREIGIALAALPEKLDKAAYDGFSSPMQFAEKVLGYSHTAAADIVATGRIYADPNSPEAWRNMPISNLAELLRADREAALKATAIGDIKADTPQSDITAFKQAHPKATKTGKPKVVTILVDSIGGIEGTEEEHKARLNGEGYELFKAKALDLIPHDAPDKHLSVRVYVRLWYAEDTGEPMTEVHRLIPKYEPESPKPTPEELAKAQMRDALIRQTMARKRWIYAAAEEWLIEEGLIDALPSVEEEKSE